MKCEAARTWLTQCDSMQVRTWPKKIVRHVRRCQPCRHFARGILRIEEGWRNLPLPEEGKAPSPAFLKQIDNFENPPLESEQPNESQPKKKRKPAAKPMRRTYTPMRWLGAIAAMLLIGVGALVYLAMNPRPQY